MTATTRHAALFGSIAIAASILAAGPAIAALERDPALWQESSFAFARPLSIPGWQSGRADGLLGLWTCLDCDGRRGSVVSSLAVYLAASALVGEGRGDSAIGWGLEAVSASGRSGDPCLLSLGWINVDGSPWKGLRFSPLCNWSSAPFRGVQWSTGLNRATEVVGLQIGLVNLAGSVTGAQIGLVNLSSSPDAVQIGLVNLRPRG